MDAPSVHPFGNYREQLLRKSRIQECSHIWEWIRYYDASVKAGSKAIFMDPGVVPVKLSNYIWANSI